MLYIQTNREITLVQKIVMAIIVIAILVGLFFISMALLPVIAIVFIYAWYKMRQTMKKVNKARENMFEEQMKQEQQYRERVINSEQFNAHNSQEQKSAEKEVIYDISPQDYSVEEKTK